MRSKYKILGSIALIAASIYVFNTALDYFIIRSIKCDENQQNLTDEQRDKRIKNLNRAVENTIGIDIGGHDIPAISIHPKQEKIDKLRENLCFTDWDILADIYIETELDYFKRYGRRGDYVKYIQDKLTAIEKMFLEGEDKTTVTILKNKIDSANISSEYKDYLKIKLSYH
jgi:hypothetical protein